ncbi:MAG: glycerol kinase GlpK [Clostridia bacterium]|nr:glycerol kinase GlpK [Clostridia bacterium]MBO7295929.1 glycerol kinase GlpK [Clostridia bacterium]
MKQYLLAMDQGTTSCRAIIFSAHGEIIATAQKEFTQYFPADGWVEHNPTEIWATQIGVAHEALAKSGLDGSDIAAIGITNQRETTVVWDKHTGKPIYNAIVWQCRRTADYCDKLNEQGLADTVRAKTGLLIDSYFSATKLRWILQNVPGAMEKARKGDLLFGTIDTWLIWMLTGGKVHATDPSNAARTMLYNIHTLTWDKDLLELFEIPESTLPSVLPSSGVFGYTKPSLFGCEIPIAGVAGDQQAALFGQCCFDKGDVKNTYGTGGFMLMNTGATPITSQNGLVTTIGWRIGDQTQYVLEGSVFICGAAVQWLRDGLGLIRTSADSERLAMSVKDTAGVYFVPAFVGLGAPYWDAYARGCITGLTRATTKAHIVRATLEAMAYQTADVLAIMEREVGTPVHSLKVDGGASANGFLLQFQSNIISKSIVRPTCIETTALGAACLAGLAVGVYESTEHIRSIYNADARFEPMMSPKERDELYNGWKRAVKRTLSE